MAKAQRTNNAELVETDNLRKALERLEKVPGSYPARALYHALHMAGMGHLAGAVREKAGLA